MSAGVFIQDEEGIERLEVRRLLERIGSVEPEDPLPSFNPVASPMPGETPEQRRIREGHSKRAFPKRVILLLCLTLAYAVSSVSTAAAGMDISYRFVCHFLNVDQSRCFVNERANFEVSKLISVMSIIRGCLSVVVNSYLSSMSDRLGRKPLFITATLLTAFSHISSWYIVFRMENPSTYWWLLVPNIIDALGGGVGLIVSTGISYISDMVPEAIQRTYLIAFLDGCIFFSIALGPTIGSWIIRSRGLEILYVVSAVILCLTAVAASLLLKESLSAYHKRRNSIAKRDFRKTLNPLTFSHVQDPRSRRNARILLTCSLVGTDFTMAFAVILMIYPKKQFDWSAVESGYLVSSMASVRTFWFLLGFPFLYRKLGRIFTVHSDKVDYVDVTLLRLGLVFAAVGSALMGWSTHSYQFFTSGLLDACGAIAFPIYRSALLKYVEPGTFGSFMGAHNLVMSLPNIIAPTLFLRLYSWAISWRPYLPFEVMLTVYTCIIVLTFLLSPARD